MIRSVKYQFDDRQWEVRFPNPKAMLPVRDKLGNTVLKPWGRRPMDKGKLPLGSIAKLPHLQSGRWDSYFPKKVRILVNGFCVADVAGNEHWYQVMPGQFLQGVCATWDAELRIYIISQDTPPNLAEFESWPKILSAP